MDVVNEDDWQRDTEHPTSRALLSFLEADVRRGMSLAASAAIECETGRGIRAEVVRELERVQSEVRRWVARARDRHIPLGPLTPRVAELVGAVDAVLRVSKVTSP